MADTQQVTDFDPREWSDEVKKALKAFLVKAANNGLDFSPECKELRRLFDAVPPQARSKPTVAPVMNRLASLAMVDPKLFNPNTVTHAMRMQDIAINRCTAIMQCIHNGEKE